LNLAAFRRFVIDELETSPMQSTKRCILCAEPYADTRSMLGHLLERANYEVISANTIADALQVSRNRRFSLYLLSDRYEDGTALELCQRLRQFDLRTPILFYSTYAREADRESGLKAGAQCYLSKPGDIFELRDAITRLVDFAESSTDELMEDILLARALEETNICANQNSVCEKDRRSRRRIYQPFPVTVYGNDVHGHEFETRGVLDNLSAKGLYLRLSQFVERGAKLCIVVRPSTAPQGEAHAPFVAVNGQVLRAEPQRDGACGLGVAFHDADFFETWSWALR
jgi:two-component system, response regulator, stage 0 sporulation protein F